MYTNAEVAAKSGGHPQGLSLKNFNSQDRSLFSALQHDPPRDREATRSQGSLGLPYGSPNVQARLAASMLKSDSSVASAVVA
jgi:hypothetical protein